MSTFELSYTADEGAGFLAPLRGSLATMGRFFGESLGLLVQLIAVLLPWAVAAGAVLFGARWLRRRRAEPEE